ncbi:MAG: L-histidine N(alpha)-methyltransferase [Deltaproteobacteria bacterium]
MDPELAPEGAAAACAELEEVLAGLASSPKRLPCKLLYDARGSALFERITQLPEYYCARVELSILREHAREMARRLGPERLLVELGSGSSRKTRVLLDQLMRPVAYVPIDISPSALEASSHALRARYPRLDVRPLVADYTREFRVPRRASDASGKVSVFFPGSTLGNFEPQEAVAFLRRVRELCGPDQRWLIGVDTPKERRVLEPAYDDSEGVTAAFNRNILHVLNREYGADFHPERFAHQAIWKPEQSYVEMQLVSRRAQVVSVAQRAVRFDAGEPIITEHCHKYSREAFQRLAHQAGFEVERVWLDPEERFSLHLLSAQ